MLSRELGAALDCKWLSDRCRVQCDASLGARYVLYVATVALRADENPALDVAIKLAIYLSQPLLVHAFFDDRAPHATARRAAFIFESVCELERDLHAKGIPFSFQMFGDGQRQPYHLTMASRAGCVVMDEPFIAYHLQTVAKIVRCGSPSLTVDSSCLLPARLVSAADCKRAYRFREKTSRARQEAIKLGYPQNAQASLPEALCLGSAAVTAMLKILPFRLEGLSDRTFQQISERSALDFSVAPVSDRTRGGSSHGLRRWTAFVKNGLASYNKRRNDPLLHFSSCGVSRMSPYLNLGIVSPFRIAGDASRAKSAGSTKFLDEFGIWREMAYAFCFHNPAHLENVRNVIPAWAYKTLMDHHNDARQVRSLRELADAKSGEPLWDLAQLSLVLNGELHNSLRMTWGKEVLRWTQSPEEAFSHLVYLNDHFALDGLSPPSIAGIAWCLGWADGPKTAQECTIFGTVRARSAASIGRKLDLVRLEGVIRAPPDGGELGDTTSSTTNTPRRRADGGQASMMEYISLQKKPKYGSKSHAQN
jgi:deoxyribodipyrimidine photolyase